MEKIFFAITFLLFCAVEAHAGGAVVQRQQMQRRAMQQRMMQQADVEATISVPKPEKAAAVATLEDVLASFEHDSRAWALIIDSSAKEMVIKRYFRKFYEKGVYIRKTPAQYASMIDSMAQESPEMLQQPMMTILQIAAILQYDFDNGQNQDEMALKVLGSRQAVEKHKKALYNN